MSTVVPTSFPFALLREEELLAVSSAMLSFEFISLSLCSESTKNLLQSVGRKCDRFEVTLDHQCKVWILFILEGPYFGFYSTKTDDYNLLNRNRFGAYGRQNVEWSFENFTMRKWLQHLMYIFNQRSIDLHVKSNTYDLESIWKTFDGLVLDKLTIEDIGEEYTKNLLQHLPCTEEIHLRGTIGHSELCKLSIQNFRSFRSGRNLIITLNDLLLNNSLHLSIDRTNLTTKELNRFLKMWRNGSNPRLKSLHIVMPLDSDSETTVKDKILEGLCHQQEPIDSLVIRRRDGTRAAVCVYFWPHPVFQMKVLD